VSETVKLKYTGSTPGADSNSYELFSTITAGMGGNLLQSCGLKRYMLDLEHDNAGTILVSKTEDRGTTWVVVSSTAIAAPAANSTTQFDVLVEPFGDFKVVWTNGGSAQGSFIVSQVLTDERSPAS